MKSKNLFEITQTGTSIWLDDLSRERLIDAESPLSLARLINDRFITGVTTNPAIFSQAIGTSALYDEDIRQLAMNGKTAEEIITELTISDVQNACDQFRNIFQESDGIDGRVSIEVDPRLARDTHATIIEAKNLWNRVDRANVLIKVPATREGLPAITELIAEGISVNVTLIFSVTRYNEVLDAFIQGLHRRVQSGLALADIHSVASFFVSRVDTEVDQQLTALAPHQTMAETLLGKAAIANAHLAYERFSSFRDSSRWQELEKRGARIQRPLWASTGVKDRRYPDDRYVVELTAPHTVNTMPQATLDAVHDHGISKGDAITPRIPDAHETVRKLAQITIDLDRVAETLEEEGLTKFVTPWLQLIDRVHHKAANVAHLT